MGPGTLHLPARGRGQRGRSAGAERHMSEGMLLQGAARGKRGHVGNEGFQDGAPGAGRCGSMTPEPAAMRAEALDSMASEVGRFHTCGAGSRGDESAQMSFVWGEQGSQLGRKRGRCHSTGWKRLPGSRYPARSTGPVTGIGVDGGGRSGWRAWSAPFYVGSWAGYRLFKGT